MISINTNFQSFLIQNNLTKATNANSQAIERMATGFKINHAADNAANYSISEAMSRQVSSYGIAQDNISAGMDLLSTAMDTISLMQSSGARLHSLAIQARNGSYGALSLEAINSEANAILQNIMMQYTSTEYNGINLFDNTSYVVADDLPKAGENGFINGEINLNLPEATYNGFISDPTAVDAEGNPIDVDSLPSVAGLSDFSSASAFKISSKAELEHFRDLVNQNKDTTDKTFYLNADIDLGAVDKGVTNWTPIGDYATTGYFFKGTFDGNGHKIYNLSINEPDKSYQGLFGKTSKSVKIRNVCVEGRVSGNEYTGGLVGFVNSASDQTSSLENCYSKVAVKGQETSIGGLVGYFATGGTISNCYATGNVTGRGNAVGGLAGRIYIETNVSNCYATGAVTGEGGYIGGLTGYSDGTFSNCYATGAVTGKGNNVGGLIGRVKGDITNCYATGAVTGEGSYTGGVVGYANTACTISNCYATGVVTGTEQCVGGLAGYIQNSVTNSYATGAVTGKGNNVGGLAGYIHDGVTVTDSYATGNVKGSGEGTGGLIGRAYINSIVTNSYATGSVSGVTAVGGLAGKFNGTKIQQSYSGGTVNGKSFVGGLVGMLQRDESGTVTIKDSVSYSKIRSGNNSGSFIGGYVGEYDGNTCTLTLDNCTSAVLQGKDMIGGYYTTDDSGVTYTKDDSYDMTPFLAQISEYQLLKTDTKLQVGINSDASSQITFDTSLEYDLSVITSKGIQSDEALDSINTFLKELSEKSTHLGAVANRLDSALESTGVALENLVSSRSTIKDADIAKESASYIKTQILKQAAATLLATANQNPSIALQLI